MHVQRFERALASAIERVLGSRVRFAATASAPSRPAGGLDHDPRAEILAALERFTIDDLRAFVQPLATAGLALVVVGDTDAHGHAGARATEREWRDQLTTLDELVVY